MKMIDSKCACEAYKISAFLLNSKPLSVLKKANLAILYTKI